MPRLILWTSSQLLAIVLVGYVVSEVAVMASIVCGGGTSNGLRTSEGKYVDGNMAECVTKKKNNVRKETVNTCNVENNGQIVGRSRIL